MHNECINWINYFKDISYIYGKCIYKLKCEYIYTKVSILAWSKYLSHADIKKNVKDLTVPCKIYACVWSLKSIL